MSYADLKDREDRAELMEDAFTFEYGESLGEQIKQCNPLYHEKVKELTAKVEKAKG